MRNTKIIATLGPATDSEEQIVKMYEAWANIIRFNFSHVNYDYFTANINKVKKLNAEGKTNLSILLDTKGPEIRTKHIEDKVELETGEEFILSTLEKEEEAQKDGRKVIVSDYEYTIEDVNIGRVVDIDSGLLKVEVISKEDFGLVCIARNSHVIGSKRHINLPGVKLRLPGLTEQDKKDITFGMGFEFDYIAMSFVRCKENIQELREFLVANNFKKAQIISKVESEEALDNIDEIVEYSDGIMVARGDLGIEVPMERLPLIQKEIVDKCRATGKLVVVATHMLETMIDNPVPTRAEVSDVYNAVMQKADATMLSGETAIGKFSIDSIKQMASIHEFSETQISKKHNYFDVDLGEDEPKKVVVKNAVYLADDLDAKGIVVFTNKGFMAKTAAKYRPNVPVFAFTFSDTIVKGLNMRYAVKPFVIEKKSNEENLEVAKKIISENLSVSEGDRFVVLIDGEESKLDSPITQIIRF